MLRGPKISLVRLSWEDATTRKHFEGSGKYPKCDPHEHMSKNHSHSIFSKSPADASSA